MEKLYTVSRNKTGSCLWLRSWTPYCQITLKLRKVGKITRPFRYDLSQIPYDYTVEVRNRFKGLDLIDREPDELWMEVQDIVLETGIKNHPHGKEMQKSKMAVWGGLTNSCEKRSEKQRRKGNLNAEFQRMARRDWGQGPFLSLCIPNILQIIWHKVHCQ